MTFVDRWRRFWLAKSHIKFVGNIATNLAVIGAPPHKDRVRLAKLSSRGYISTSAIVYHDDLEIGSHVFIDDRVVLFQRQRSDQRGGKLVIGERVQIYRDSILETGFNGSLEIGAGTSIHPRCQLNAYLEMLKVGKDVMLAPNCALYPYDHGINSGQPIGAQPLHSKGPIIIGDGSWLGFGVIVLGGVTIGKGAVVAAGSIVRDSLPDNSIAAGSPARVVGMRPQASSRDN